MTELAVKERPILFSGAMVRALLAGTKTQTRRAIKHVGIGKRSGKPLPIPDYTGRFVNSVGSNLWAAFGSGEERPDGAQNTVNTMRSGWFPCPYGQPGDRLWVRETLYWDECGEEWCYQAGNEPVMIEEYTGILAKQKPAIPSIHMPRAASRLLLEIVSVRVERVQVISEGDAVAEGVEYELVKGNKEWLNYLDDWAFEYTARDSYATLWDKINGEGSFLGINPWVWVVEFKVVSA